MIFLPNTTDKLQLVTSAAIAVDSVFNYGDFPNAGGTPSFAPEAHAITTATTTDVLGSPAASTTRKLKSATMRNKGASSVNVTVLLNRAGTQYELHKATLAPDDCLMYVEGVGFFERNDSLGGLMRNQALADQAIPVAATYILGSDLSLAGVKVGTRFRWRIVVKKTAAGVASQAFDVRYGSGVVGDTSRFTGATGTETAAIDVAEVNIEATVRGPIGAACIVHHAMDLHHNLASTGFALTPNVDTEAASAAFDITASTKVGVSTTPGASAVVTVVACQADRCDP